MPITFADYEPKTLEEAVDFIVYNLNSEETKYITEKGTVGLHHTFGMAMRNYWSLWNSLSPLGKHFRHRFKLGHADDMSGMILEAVRCKAVGVPYCPDHDANYYREYWLDKNTDPLTQEELNKHD